MKVALIGYAQSGKKTLFALLTGRDASSLQRGDAQSIEGVARVHDERVDVLTRIAKPKVTRYAENQIVLVPDVPPEGSGRTWLDAARKCDLICVLLRDFASDSIYHPLGSVDATRDRQAIAAELLLADLERVETRLERLAKEKRAGQTNEQKQQEAVLERCRTALESETPLREAGLDEDAVRHILSLELLTLKPVLWVRNVGEDRVADAEAPDGSVFRVSCRIEHEIAAMGEPEERQAFLEDLGLSATGGERLNAAAYDMLGLMSFYTMGPDEVRAWTIRKGTPAPRAAGKIHSDLERGFIRAEIIAYEDLVACGSEAEAKAVGKAQLRGKDYVIQDGDICHFLFNV